MKGRRFSGRGWTGVLYFIYIITASDRQVAVAALVVSLMYRVLEGGKWADVQYDERTCTSVALKIAKAGRVVAGWCKLALLLTCGERLRVHA